MAQSRRAATHSGCPRRADTAVGRLPTALLGLSTVLGTAIPASPPRRTDSARPSRYAEIAPAVQAAQTELLPRRRDRPARYSVRLHAGGGSRGADRETFG